MKLPVKFARLSGDIVVFNISGAMRPFVAVLTILLASLSGFAMEPPACFLGRWKSDEALTLADMRKHPEITEKARALFENKFFGHLILVNGPSSSGWYLEDIQGPQAIIMEPYDVVDRGTDWMVLRNKQLGIQWNSMWYCEGPRMYALVSKWEFREYFSPLP